MICVGTGDRDAAATLKGGFLANHGVARNAHSTWMALDENEAHADTVELVQGRRDGTFLIKSRTYNG